MRKFNYKYLNDYNFLKEVDAMKNKEQYVKITVLDFQEKPIKEIQGRVTGGSGNVDGSSSLRRSCNLSMVADEFGQAALNIDGLLSMNKKISVEIGFLNTLNKYKEYDIIWFPLGIFVIINSNCSHSKDGLNISLQLKDKMCLLNGECGGVIPASTTFHEYEYFNYEVGDYSIEHPLIYQIILELVNHLGGEDLNRIIISDVPVEIKQVMKWGDQQRPLYIYQREKDNDFVYAGLSFDGVAKEVCEGINNQGQDWTAEQWENWKEKNEDQYTAVTSQIKKYPYGYDVGFTYIAFTYPGELICNAGDTICSVLDKIKTTLGNYEYFYDVEGNFIFQEIKNYLNTNQATTILNKIQNSPDYQVNYWAGSSAFKFDNSNLISAFANNPQYSMIKNDFIVWGKRKSPTGVELPIRYHLAIDSKPVVGNTYQVYIYEDKIEGVKRAKKILRIERPQGENYIDKSDSEILYLQQLKDTTVVYQVIGDNNYYQYDVENDYYIRLNSNDIKNITTSDWRTELYFQGISSSLYGTSSNNYFVELVNEWPKLYDIEKGAFYSEVEDGTEIDYFLDFIDDRVSNVGKYGVSNIGRRSKVITDDKVNCIFEPKIPEIVWLPQEDSFNVDKLNQIKNQGYAWYQAPNNIWNKIIGGGHFNSAFVLIQDLLYQYTQYNETISVTSIPIYYLEPNIRIEVNDFKSGIYGDYIIKSFSLSFDVGGIMTLSCTKALEKI